jgi:hypothetical protein
MGRKSCANQTHHPSSIQQKPRLFTDFYPSIQAMLPAPGIACSWLWLVLFSPEFTKFTSWETRRTGGGAECPARWLITVDHQMFHLKCIKQLQVHRGIPHIQMSI